MSLYLAALLVYAWGCGAFTVLLFLFYALTRPYENWQRLLIAFLASWAWPVIGLAWFVGWEPSE